MFSLILTQLTDSKTSGESKKKGSNNDKEDDIYAGKGTRSNKHIFIDAENRIGIWLVKLNHITFLSVEPNQTSEGLK